MTALAVAGVVALLVVPTRGSSARPHERACPRTTLGTTTFELRVSGVRCDVALAVVARFQVTQTTPRGWACVDVFCWRGAGTYESARTRIAKLVDVTIEPGPISRGRCESRHVEISARQYISCPAARRALARYLARAGQRRHDQAGGSFVSCSGDARTGGFCAITFPSGAQGHFTYRPGGSAA